MDRYQEQGKACYKRAEYRKAIELFDRAIGRQASVQLLDHRAACYEKLGNFQAALENAKKAIQLQREDPTGYLRAGKVLIQMERHSVALEIYAHGLRSIKHVGQGYELLRKVHGDLLHQLAPPKSLDPLSVLPRELAELILDYCTFQQCMNACLVSKQWAQFIRATPNLWRHLDLSQARRKVRNAFISRAINIARTKLTAATLSLLYDSDKALKALVRHCPLEELTLLETGFQNENLALILGDAKNLKRLRMGPACRIGAASVSRILDNAYNRLESLECFRIDGRFRPPTEVCQKMVALDVTLSAHPGPHLQDYTDFAKVVTTGMHNLQSLRWHVLRGDLPIRRSISLVGLKQLKRLDVRLPVDNITSFLLPASITYFALACTTPVSARSFWSTSSIPGSIPFLPALEELLVNVPGTTMSYLDDILNARPSMTAELTKNDQEVSKLRTLEVDGAEINAEGLRTLLANPRMQTLLQLAVRQSEGWDDGCMSHIASTLPKLTRLDVSQTKVTGVGVKEVVSQGHLTRLTINDCRLVGLDAAAWARLQRVQVSCQATL